MQVPGQRGRSQVEDEVKACFQLNTYAVKLNLANYSLQTVVAYNWKTGNVVKRFRGHEHDITKVKLSSGYYHGGDLELNKGTPNGS